MNSRYRHLMGPALLSIVVALTTLADHSQLPAASLDPQNVLDSGIQPEDVDRQSYKGLFRGHPAKPYYESINGVGDLLVGLLELHELTAN